MKKSLLIGSSGFLGRSLGKKLATSGNVIFTHCNHSYFPTSTQYDFFNNDVAEILANNNIATIVFAAFVEGHNPHEVEAAMKQFVKRCQDRRLVYLSSDGIFDGTKGQYSERDEPNPSTKYGRNLKLCEQVVQEQSSDYCIIRPSYIYGYSNGELDQRLEKTRKRLMGRERVELFDDMYKSPLGVNQVAEAVIKLGQSSYVGIVHVAGERMSVYEFHYQAMKAMGVDTKEMERVAMPEKAGYLRDTSLKTEKWEKITGMRALSIEQTLSGSGVPA